MKTLYVRIVLTFAAVAFASGIIGIALTNWYYERNMKNDNENKLLAMSRSIVQLHEQNPNVELVAFLEHIADLGFQIYAVDENMQAHSYGAPFKRGVLSDAEIRSVLEGETYRGMEGENRRLQLIGLFENSVRNTIGVPIRTAEGSVALFIRTDMEKQIGEIRIIVAVLLGVTFAASLVLIVMLSRLIVKPLTVLKRATQRIVKGDFDIGAGLASSAGRKDEIGELAKHFAHMARSLGELDRMRQAFVANVSHEFQSPLTSIQGFSRAMLDKRTTPEETDRYLAVIEAESKRLSSLSKQLLKLAELDREGARLQTTTFRLDEQIRTVMITLEWQWSEKKLELDMENMPEIESDADAQLLHEVWLNLLMNAIRFTEPGGRIDVAIREEGDAVAVEISDTGAGIPDDELPYVFDRFHKADKARNRASSGSGLGLSIVRAIVELHGGTVEVRSKLGEGTTFVVRLPQRRTVRQ
ncbi:sensor histidine kinase [Cohnella soli]|uniref:Heme sensor protein HssS n=1 Tax=Cohnella soli TaxID=425005 RepID=A0ABW0I1N3_9BACL